MQVKYTFDIIARVHTPFIEKFGIPRQSGLADEVCGEIVFEEAFRNPDALRGIEDFSHIWLLWCFSEHTDQKWHPTVRPPRFDGSKRLGVFATRSPYRPNPIGLSLVQLESVDFQTQNGPVLHISGPDLMNGTPLFDIKPYIPYADCRPEASDAYVGKKSWERLQVKISPELLASIPSTQRKALHEILAQDPRPAYHNDPERIYGLSFSGYNVRFIVQDAVLQVIEVDSMQDANKS